MTRNECMKIINDKSNPDRKKFIHLFRTNYNKCRKYYNNLGYKGYTLHHKNICCTNYEEWKIDEIEPMTRSEHSKLHMCYYNQGLNTEESKIKAHKSLKEKYARGELQIWNKGLTKEIDSRIPESPRKGKTGNDFPFLKASKKGKSGGWNRGILPSDPRYESILFDENRKKEFSERMKNKSANGENDSFIYSCKGTIFINNGIISKRINKNSEIPDGWVRGRIKYERKNISSV